MIYCDLKNILKEKNKSAYWLAKKTDVTYPTILDFVNNKKIGIQYDTLEQFCIALDCEISDIIKMDKKKTTKRK